MAEEIYGITESQWQEVNSALLTAARACTVHAPSVRDIAVKASIIMDHVIDANEKPLSTYAEDRGKMLALCEKAALSDDAAAIELADLVKAILEDEMA